MDAQHARGKLTARERIDLLLGLIGAITRKPICKPVDLRHCSVTLTNCTSVSTTFGALNVWFEEDRCEFIYWRRTWAWKRSGC